MATLVCGEASRSLRMILSRSADFTSFPPLIPFHFVGLRSTKSLGTCGWSVRVPSACLLFPFVLDYSMNRFVGPLLLLGLGLCAASGCALSGPSRMSGLAQRMPWASEKSARSESSRQERDSQGIVSFRTPTRRTKESAEKPFASPGPSRREVLTSAATSEPESTGHSAGSTRVTDSTKPPSVARDEVGSNSLLAGHSSDRLATLQERVSQTPRPASVSLPRSPSAVVQAGHEQRAFAETIEPLPGEAVTSSNVTTANYRSDRDALDNPVELQGFESIAPTPNATTAANSNEPPLWANRPAAKPVSTAVGQVHLSSKSGGRVQQVSTQAAPVVSPGPWQVEIERLIARSERDVAGLRPGSTLEAQAEYRRRQVHLRLLYLMAQRQEQALTAIPGLEPAEQEYWQQLCWAASNSLDAEQFPSLRDRAAQSIPPLNTALRRLREQSDLAIKNIAFCEQISYFGNYQKFARDEFTPGQEVLLYAEIENFNTEQTADGEHRTLLRSVIDIVGSNGEARWHKTFPATEDRCRNPRRDYFHNYQFAIPDRLPLGPHTLKLTVIDDLSGKQASYSLSFLVK